MSIMDSSHLVTWDSSKFSGGGSLLVEGRGGNWLGVNCVCGGGEGVDKFVWSLFLDDFSGNEFDNGMSMCQ